MPGTPFSATQRTPRTDATPSPTAGLRVRTVRIPDSVSLLDYLPRAASAVWLHHGQGLVGIGTVATIETTGGDRFRRASEEFQKLSRASRVENDVRCRGTGLVALGSFSYAASSSRPSRLVIPEAILGCVDGTNFLTLITPADGPHPGSLLSEVLHADLLTADRRDLPAWHSLFAPTPALPQLEVDLDPDHVPEQYQALVSSAVETIRAGEVEKVVLSECTTAQLSQPVPVTAVVAELARLYPSTWVYRMGDVMGASPEMLAQSHQGRVFSRVLAGTRSVADGEELSEQERLRFHADQKERSEHAYAVDSVTSRLTEVAADVSASQEPFVLRLPGIAHLASDVSGRLREGTTSLDVAATLHPSAAVSGTPREQADQVIARLEPRDRGGYAAPVGWMDADGNGQWAIALRMAHGVEDAVVSEVRIQAGGGVVAASDPVSEHAEVLTKSRPVLRALMGHRS